MPHTPSTFEQVFPLTILIILAVGIPTALLIINHVFGRFGNGPKTTTPGKDVPYESGLPTTVGGADERFSLKFYLIAMLFLAFDIEVAFLYAWAWQFGKADGWGLFWILIVFLLLLEAGYLYLYKKGALDWDR